MNILLVEDSENRIKWFKSVFIGHNVKIISSFNTNLNEFKNQNYDIAFFDFDLNEERTVNSSEIAKELKNYINKAVIHTLSENGRLILSDIFENKEKHIISYLKLRDSNNIEDYLK